MANNLITNRIKFKTTKIRATYHWKNKKDKPAPKIIAIVNKVPNIENFFPINT